MNSLSSRSFQFFSVPISQFSSRPQVKCQSVWKYNQCCKSSHLPSPSLSFPLAKHSLRLNASESDVSVTMSTLPEGAVPVMDLVEKDWSFLEFDDQTDRLEDYDRNINRIISAGKVDENSRVLVSIGSEGFVDRLANLSAFLLVVHESLLPLAIIKGTYDKVRCWQGEIIYVPEKWAPFDVVFLYFLPGLPFELRDIFKALAEKCSPGARLVISYPQRRDVLEQQRKEFPEAVVSQLPDKITLQKAAEAHLFEMAEFVDETDLYLAVLNYSGDRK